MMASRPIAQAVAAHVGPRSGLRAISALRGVAAAAAPRASTSSLPATSRAPFAIATSRSISTSTPRRLATEAEGFDLSQVERAEDECDVLIVGGGPAGLSAAIKIKQLAEAAGEEIRVVLLEKGAEVGNHILSGAVIQTNALEELFPDWKELGAPLKQPALEDHMRFLTEKGSFPMPHPPQMSNKGNYIVSLSQVTSWLAEQAEGLGVEIYPGFAGSTPIWEEDASGNKIGLKGIITNDTGLGKDGKPKDSYEPGMAFRAPVTLLAEGAHGSLSERIIKELKLREAVGADPQTYGLGIKEVWKVKPEKHQPGLITHTLGWPLDFKTYGGSWCYHMDEGLVSIGLVVGLDYENPHLSPYREFQRMKHHPLFADLLEGGECQAYGARALNEGGYQSIPKLHFPGGALLGCSAGFLNVPKIKGTHNAMKSGMLAAEAVVDGLRKRNEAGSEEPLDIADYKAKLDDSWVMKELKEVRNLRPSFHNPLGLYGGIMYSGIDSLILKGRTPWTFHHKGEDRHATKPASECEKIEYPKPDGKLSFDILESVSRTGTNHTEDQPVHLVVENKAEHVKVNYGTYGGPLARACPAGVYDYQDGGDNAHWEGKDLVINNIACIHCKTCSIKEPTGTLRWAVPEGGGGPKYSLT